MSLGFDIVQRSTAREWRAWLIYFCAVAGLSALCFASLRTHLLDTHDAESFSDHLRIAEDWRYFFSPEKEQATGRLLADGVKYATFLVFDNDVAAFHLLVVFVHTIASLLLALLVRRMGYALELAFAGGLLFLVNVSHADQRRTHTRHTERIVQCRDPMHRSEVGDIN